MDEQIEGWATKYMSAWPEILAKQLEDYGAQGLDWRQVARDRIFPHLAAWMPAMQAAQRVLLETCWPIYAQAQQVLGFERAVTFVIHVGIGCGAGWATRLGGHPAILFGLENIADCGWSDPGSLAGLVAHELGHLVHSAWRDQNAKPDGSGPWWQLYEEGFAQTCECRIRDTEIGHQSNGNKEQDWLKWCRDNTGWLATEFLRRVEAGEPVTDFFGSWFQIQGQSETGYFLGQQVIQELEKQADLKEIALLENVEAVVRPILEKMAKRNGG